MSARKTRPSKLKQSCTAPCGCTRALKWIGLCVGHYTQARRGVDPLQPLLGRNGRPARGDRKTEYLPTRVTPARRALLERLRTERGYSSLYEFTAAVLCGLELVPRDEEKIPGHAPLSRA